MLHVLAALAWSVGLVAVVGAWSLVLVAASRKNG